MMALLWVPLALGAAICRACSALLSEYSRVNSMHMALWMRIMAILLYTPIVLNLERPDNPWFYVCVVATGVIFAFYDVLVFTLTKKNGAGLITRLEPLSVWVTFFLWTLISPSLLFSYIHEPLRGTGILFSISLCVFFALRLRHCPICLETLKVLFPYILISSVALILAKLAFDMSPLHSGVFYYGYVQSASALLVYMVMLKRSTMPIIPRVEMHDFHIGRRAVFFGILIGCVWVMNALTKHYAISLAENPAYVTMLGLTSPLWVLAFYKAKKQEEKTDIFSGLGIVASVVLLVVFTQL